MLHSKVVMVMVLRRRRAGLVERFLLFGMGFLLIINYELLIKNWGEGVASNVLVAHSLRSCVLYNIFLPASLLFLSLQNIFIC